jgi:long-chain acyl-CoA synthetase
MRQDRMQYVSPYAALEKIASDQPEADAIIIDDTRLSHSEMLRRITHCAGWLSVNGVMPGEVTGICVRDEINHLVCAMALLCMGTPQISLGLHETDETKRRLARKVGATKLIVEKIEPWMTGLRTVVVPRGEIAHAPGAAGSELFCASLVAAVAVYMTTSGTTNVPKAFDLSYGRLITSANRYMADPKERRSLRPGSVEFDAVRLNRVCSLLAGNTCVGFHQYGLDRLASICERESVSVLRVGPYQLASLLRSCTSASRLPPATAILVSGARVCGALRKQVQAEISENLWVQYATSETGLISTAAPQQHDAFPEGIGFPEQGVSVEIVGSEGETISTGEVGHVRIRKDTMTAGYMAEPDACAKFQEGWFYPGDLLSREGDGPLIFHGRADDVMILDGVNVFPSAIEDALESLPGVLEAVAFPIKSRVHGEIPAAAVVLSGRAAAEEISGILSYCQQLLGIRAPRQIRVVSTIPRNAAGKPLRRELAAL